MLEASIQVRIMRITHSSRGTLEAKMITERRIQCGINCNLATSELFEIYTIGMASTHFDSLQLIAAYYITCSSSFSPLRSFSWYAAT